MNDSTCLSEIIWDGEQICIIRDIYEQHPPECTVCNMLRFCEEPRSREDVEQAVNIIERNRHRREFFQQMEEDGYYDE